MNNDEEINISSLPIPSSPPHRHRENTRRTVAYWLLMLISAITTFLCIGVICHLLNIEQAKDLALILLAPIVSVFGIVIGFFFGEERKSC